MATFFWQEAAYERAPPSSVQSSSFTSNRGLGEDGPHRIPVASCTPAPKLLIWCCKSSFFFFFLSLSLTQPKQQWRELCSDFPRQLPFGLTPSMCSFRPKEYWEVYEPLKIDSYNRNSLRLLPSSLLATQIQRQTLDMRGRKKYHYSSKLWYNLSENKF